MEVECRFFGPFREDVGRERVTLDVDDGETYGDLLARLEERYATLEGRLVDAEDTTLAGSTVVTRNKTDLRHLDGLETTVEDGDVIRAIPSVYGG